MTPVGFTDIGYRYFIVYAVLNASFVVLLFIFFPETAGRQMQLAGWCYGRRADAHIMQFCRSLEEIDAIFVESKTIFDPPRVARRLPRQYLADITFDAEIVAAKEKVDHVERAEAEKRNV